MEVVDTLDHGLAFDSLISVTASPSVTTSLAGGDFLSVVSPVSGSTGTLRFDLGNVSSVDDYGEVNIRYQVFVENSQSLKSGDVLSNDAELRWDIDNSGSNQDAIDGSVVASAAGVSVVEPVVSIKKSVDDLDPHLGQTVNYTLLLSNEG